ncbi:unnamed protein product [Brassica oleracea var. botrytis]
MCLLDKKYQLRNLLQRLWSSRSMIFASTNGMTV